MVNSSITGCTSLNNVGGNIRLGGNNASNRATLWLIDSVVTGGKGAGAKPEIGTLSAEERDIGGLGIYMVKKSMDEITYDYKDGQNILKIKKHI